MRALGHLQNTPEVGPCLVLAYHGILSIRDLGDYQQCLMKKSVDLKLIIYHPLQMVHQPRELVYMDLIGPVTGIR